MSSEIRVNKINNRAGLGTVTYTDTGIIVSGVSTASNFKTGTSDLHSAGLNVAYADVDDFVDVGNIIKLGNAGVVTATTFSTANVDVTTDKIVVGTGVTFEANQVANGQATFTGIVTASAFKLSDGSNVGGVESDSASNTLGGTNAGDSITSGDNNTFFGKDAGTDITDGQFNTFLGSLAGSNTNSGTYLNTFVGYNAGVNNGNGNHNVFIGANTGINNAAWDNVFIGNYSGDANTSGTRNVFIGKYAGSDNTTASDNIAIGSKAAFNLWTGARNVVMGTEAVHDGQYVDDSVVIGYKAGYNLTDDRCVLIGFEAGNQANDAQNNTFVGYRAGKDVTTGDYNVIIGDDAGNAGNDLTTGSNNILIGHDAAASSATVSNEITLGDSNISLFRVPGINLTFGNNGAVIAGVVTATSFSGDGSSLSNLPASAPVGGASTNSVFFENDIAVAVNYQITTNKNAMSAGPIAINAGIAVTVPSGSAWTIV
jgi:hypothetical protein